MTTIERSQLNNRQNKHPRQGALQPIHTQVRRFPKATGSTSLARVPVNSSSYSGRDGIGTRACECNGTQHIRFSSLLKQSEAVLQNKRRERGRNDGKGRRRCRERDVRVKYLCSSHQLMLPLGETGSILDTGATRRRPPRPRIPPYSRYWFGI